MRSKALPRAEELKVKLIEKYAREFEEKQVIWLILPNELILFLFVFLN